MENNELIRRWTNERKNLETFLLNRGTNPSEIIQGIGDVNYHRLINEISIMGKMLEQAEMIARGDGDIYFTANIGAKAKMQKDKIYCILTQAIGELPFKIEGYVKDLRDYIKARFQNGIKNCERILGEAA